MSTIKSRVTELVERLHNIDENEPGIIKQASDALFETIGQIANFANYHEGLNKNNFTITAQGKACSPEVAAMCTIEFMRNYRFQQGVLRAIQDKERKAQPVQLLYAGTGPFGSLVIPVLLLLQPQQVQVTLIDIHEESLDIVKTLVNALELEPFIVAYHLADAAQWQPPANTRYDIVVSETMKHLLEQEPQVAIFSHLQQFLADDGVLIPEEISLKARLVDQYPTLQHAAKHLFLGEFFKLNRANAKRLYDGDTSLLSTRLAIPQEAHDYPHLKLTTDITVYRNQLFRECETQLTLPRFHNDVYLTPGSQLTCTYKLHAEPDWDFVYQRTDQAAKHSAQRIMHELCGVIDFARIAIAVPLQSLLAEISTLSQHDWTPHVNQADYSGGWEVLPLRCQRQHLHAHPLLQAFSVEVGEDWEYLSLVQSCPALLDFLNSLQCPLKAVRLMRLKAGAEIKPHQDKGLGLAYGEARLHLPLHINDEVEFICNQHEVPMRAGELWYFNADRPHAVFNRSTEDRISLVIDCVANTWLRETVVASFTEQAA